MALKGIFPDCDSNSKRSSTSDESSTSDSDSDNNTHSRGRQRPTDFESPSDNHQLDLPDSDDNPFDHFGSNGEDHYTIDPLQAALAETLNELGMDYEPFESGVEHQYH